MDRATFDAEAASRLMSARKRAGYKSASAFARDAGVKIVTYQHHESGYRPINEEAAVLYAQLLRVPVVNLMSNFVQKELSGYVQIPIVGAIRRGGFIVPFAPRQQRTIAIFGATAGMVAHEVLDDSMIPVCRKGDIVVHERLSSDTFYLDDLDGLECVVRLADGQEMMRQVLLRGAPGTVTLLAHNAAPMHDVALIGAEPVRLIQRNIPARRYRGRRTNIAA